MKSEKPTSLLKCCKNCGNEFELIIPEKNGSGSSNSLRRVFCNDKCKNQFGRNKEEGILYLAILSCVERGNE